MSLTRCQNGHLFSSRKHGQICPYCNILVDSNRTREEDPQGDLNTPYLGDLEVINPVTGWLICIEGASRGRDYRIMSEKNFIGRSDDMDIQILGDNAVARRNHAVVVYDPKKRSTLLLPGDSQGLVYLNDEAIYSPCEISAYDVIELGKSKFIFIPLCGENFEWEEENPSNKEQE